MGYDSDINALKSYLRKLPWLNSIVVETYPAGSMVERIEIKAERCALTESQINNLRSELPGGIQIIKSVFRIPSP